MRSHCHIDEHERHGRAAGVPCVCVRLCMKACSKGTKVAADLMRRAQVGTVCLGLHMAGGSCMSWASRPGSQGSFGGCCRRIPCLQGSNAFVDELDAGISSICRPAGALHCSCTHSIRLLLIPCIMP